MLRRSESELQFVKTHTSLPSVEVDLDGLPEGFGGYADLVTTAITAVAAKSKEMRATIYVYQGPSVNFHQPTWSVFFGVAGDKILLDVLLAAFQSVHVVNARFSDYIDSSNATRDFHVQDGCVWRPFESGTWYTESQDQTNSVEETVGESDDLEDAVPETNLVNARNSSPTRFRIARADATVGTIRKKIEEIFGLPEGSVALCGPDKNALRGDATISTLRKRWE